MNLLKLLFKTTTSNREPDELPRSKVYRWSCATCRDSYAGSERQHVAGVAASHRQRMGGKCRTPKVYATQV
ncbi:hypothetical protein AB0D68_25415 [Streptomyces sp. NPDC048212]|uniref:hypothetical protein n=1 Tax=unclassified Streptomyces TaxID=2593676 RepID=UPI002274260D|nr:MULTISPECIES: hypothetical protein [unclassified Streptomyces]MCY1649310.1 hypothetical protein [Streptomyces sp. SL203]MCY1677022.1 hypothetical protein [Streptomyces sp. SL294]